MSKFNEIIHNISKTHGFYVFLMLLVCLAGYGAFLWNAPIYDFINQFFPCRYFTTECIRNGIFPLWNPYQSMGTPLHSDPQAGVFYLPMWLFAFCGKYTTLFCGIEFIFHTFMAAVGFYLLAWHFTGNRVASFVTACCYALSGFFIGNAEHLVWIVSATWIPWIVYAFCRFLENPSWKTLLLPPLPLSLMVSGGYPGTYFILFYLILTLLVVYIVRALLQRNWSYIWKLLLCGFSTLFLTIVLCAPTLISQLEIKPLISRGMKLTIEQTTQPFTIPSLVSVFFPYLAVSDSAFTHTDISMASIYMGLFVIPFAIYGILKNKNVTVWTIAAFGLLCLVMAFGAQTTLFRLVFKYIPLICFIRLPALFRIFFILSILLLVTVGVQNVLENHTENRNRMKIAGLLFFAVFLVISILLAITLKGQSPLSNWKEGGVAQKCLVESCMAAFFSFLFVVAFHIKNEKSAVVFLTFILMSDIVLQANLCGPKTIYDTNKDMAQMAKAYSVPGYPIPQETLDCVDIVHKHEAWSYWQNIGPFFKEVEWCSLNPVKLNTYSKMLALYLSEETPMRMPVVFCPTNVVFDTASHWLNSDTIYTDNPSLAATYNSAAWCTLRCFEPGHIVINASTDTLRPVVLCQNFYKGWRATLDGRHPLEIVPANFSMMSLYIPSGKHTVELEYKRPLYVWAFVLQVALSVLTIGLLLWLDRKEKRSKT